MILPTYLHAHMLLREDADPTMRKIGLDGRILILQLQGVFNMLCFIGLQWVYAANAFSW